MGLGVAIFLIAAGAILTFAVSPQVISGHGIGAIDLGTVGWILMLVGALGLLLSLTVWSSWAGPASFSRRRTETYVDPPVRRSATYVDDRRSETYVEPSRVVRRETIDEV